MIWKSLLWRRYSFSPGISILEKRESLWINKLEAEHSGLIRKKWFYFHSSPSFIILFMILFILIPPDDVIVIITKCIVSKCSLSVCFISIFPHYLQLKSFLVFTKPPIITPPPSRWCHKLDKGQHTNNNW